MPGALLEIYPIDSHTGLRLSLPGYRSPLPRSSIVHLRAERMIDADKDAVAGQGAVLTLSRPRVYFDLEHDALNFDNRQPAPGIPSAGAGLSTSKIKFTQVPDRAVHTSFNGETVTDRVWPGSDGHLSILELMD